MNIFPGRGGRARGAARHGGICGDSEAEAHAQATDECGPTAPYWIPGNGGDVGNILVAS